MSTHYSYTVTWSAEDLEWVGLCAEFPSLSWLAKESSGALAGIVEVVESVVADMIACGEALPEAIAERKFSGEFKVRIPPSQHRRLVLEAAKEGVSLNRLVSARLSA